MKLITPLLLIGLVACSDDTTTSVDTAPNTTAPDTTDTTDTADTADIEPDVEPDVPSEVSPDTTDTTDTGPDGDTTNPPVGLAETITALCPGYADLYCGADCGCDAAPGFPEDCKAAFEASCAALLESYLPIVDGGQAVFDPEGAATCLTNFAPLAAACVSFPNDLFFFVCPILAPPDGFPPFPAVGEACEGVCQTGLRCGTERKCIVPGELGDDCASAFDCATNLVCADDDKCAAPRLGDAGQSCVDRQDCSGETGCLASFRKVCVAAESGGACRFDEECPLTEWCESDSDGNGTCKLGGADGETCANGTVCQANLACDFVTGDCGPIPTTGQACALGRFGPFVCADGLACVDGTCGTPPGDGAPCAQGTPACAAGLGCAFETEGSICRPKADAGAECQSDDTCKDTLFCDFGTNTCTPFMLAGERCTDGNECGPTGACLPDSAFVFRCGVAGGVGDECFLDDCADDLVCKTPYTAGICTPVLCSMLRF